MALKKSKNIALAAAAEKTRRKNTAAKLRGEKTCDEDLGTSSGMAVMAANYFAQLAIVLDTSGCFK